jgi:hypothetical protein
MKLSRLFSIVVILVLGISALSIWFQSSVQDYMEGNTTWNGIKDFVSSFDANTIDSLGILDSAPKDSILLAIPTLSYGEKDLGSLAQFISNGGTLLLMDDFGYGNTFLQYLKLDVRFAPGVLLDPLFCYKNQELPRIVSFSPALAAGSINAITLNRGTSLTSVGNGDVLAQSSDMSFMDLNENGTWNQNEPKGPFVVAAEYRINAGSIVLVSDPSIIINSMLDVDENAAFMRYLTTGKGEGSQLYIDRSHLIESPLDISKLFLISARKTLSDPYAIIGVLALLFTLVALNATGKENKID